MNKNKLIGVLVILVAIIAFNACKIDENLNIDPNNPAEASIDLLLPSAQLGAAFVYGNDNARATSMWMQQHAGTDRQYIPITRYTFTESDTDTPWIDAYANSMMDLSIIIKNGASSPHYTGIAKIMMALVLGNVTDLWGDVPYSASFEGAIKVTSPTYDTQEQIYATVFNLLAEGKAEIAAATSLFSPGSNDLVYEGNLDKWNALANVLTARYSIHKSKVDPNAYAAALAALDTLTFTSNTDDALFRFYDVAGNKNFFYEFNEIQRGGYMSAGKYFVDLLIADDDPRLQTYFSKDPAGGYSGAAAGVVELEKSTTGSAYASADSPVPFVTFEEQKFIEAEAAFQTGDLGRAADAFNEAVAASMDKHGFIDDTNPTTLAETIAKIENYINLNAMEDASSITLEKIMMQKYTALFTQVEVYTDWRRTGFPKLNIAANAALTQIPRRFVYPVSERLYNTNTPSAGVSLIDRVWWDAE